MKPTLKQRKQAARIFRRAARLYQAYYHSDSDGCCLTIRKAALPLGPREVNTALDLFEKLFRKHDAQAFWWDYPYQVDYDKQTSLYPRLNALLLAAEFAETEKDWPI